MANHLRASKLLQIDAVLAVYKAPSNRQYRTLTIPYRNSPVGPIEEGTVSVPYEVQPFGAMRFP